MNESWSFCHPWHIAKVFQLLLEAKLCCIWWCGKERESSLVLMISWRDGRRCLSQPRKQLPSLLLSYPSGFEARLWLRMVLRHLRTKPVKIRYGPTRRHYSKKKLPVFYNSIYMVVLATVLLSLLEGRRRKVCQTFSRYKLQHGILLTCVQFSFENSRLSRAGSFSNTAALFTTAGPQ